LGLLCPAELNGLLCPLAEPSYDQSKRWRQEAHPRNRSTKIWREQPTVWHQRMIIPADQAHAPPSIRTSFP
jgi:hypothetical protein